MFGDGDEGEKDEEQPNGNDGGNETDEQEKKGDEEKWRAETESLRTKVTELETKLTAAEKAGQQTAALSERLDKAEKALAASEARRAEKARRKAGSTNPPQRKSEEGDAPPDQGEKQRHRKRSAFF